MNKSWWNLTKSTQPISDNLVLQNNMYCSLIDTTRTDGLTQRAQTDMDKSSLFTVSKAQTILFTSPAQPLAVLRLIKAFVLGIPNVLFLSSDFTHKQSQKQLSEYHNNIHIGIQHCCVYVPLHNLKQIMPSFFFGCQLHHSFNQ